MIKLFRTFIVVYLLFLAVLTVMFFATKQKNNNRTTSILNQHRKYPTFPLKLNLIKPPQTKILNNNYHIFQIFNNCGPAALSMGLSYYGINETQQKLGFELRPYQNPQGDNDDKSVTLEELAQKTKEYDLLPYHRPNGNINLVKLFIAYDMPVIARTWLSENEDIGHYRVIKGYDTTRQNILQDDSLQGANRWYSYEEFNNLWKKFNYEYLVLVPKDKQQIAESILQEDKDLKTAWKKATENAKKELKNNPNDASARFNLSVALYKIADYQNSILEFEKVENKIPFRTLWYQIEPIQAYYQLGNYPKVFSLINNILNDNNRAFSELYIIRGKIYKNQGNIDMAKQEFEKAVFYNKNLKDAKENYSKPI